MPAKKNEDRARMEAKWRKVWAKEGTYEPSLRAAKNPFYNLMMFPYPSAEGLHVGNMYAFTGSDVYGRFMRMQGRDVFEPIGLDGFGIHSENYAMKVGTHPATQAKASQKRFYEQLEAIGNGFAWNERVETYDPAYYKWTQWIFVKLWKAGLAYRKKQAVNWCPKDQTVLADEQVEGGRCERCGAIVEKRELEQWFFRITRYAERLLQNTKRLDWTEKVRIAQRNWIGKSDGAEVEFPLAIETYKGDIVFATNNLSKLGRMQRLFNAAGLKVTLKLPKDAGIRDYHVEENGETIAENSEKKAKALLGRTKLPILADDSAFFIEGEDMDPVKVKRNALAGVHEKDLPLEEVASRMAKFYQELARRRGGAVSAEWRNDLCLVTPEGAVLHAAAVRPVTLTARAGGKIDPYFPVRHLYIPKPTGKYAQLQNEPEELMELQPVVDAVKKLFTPALTVFTTRADTLFGATYLVLAPEHPFVGGILGKEGVVKNKAQVAAYVRAARAKSEDERVAEGKTKTGVEMKGVRAVNPATGEEIPVWVADYVLGGYGTGAIMAVPAHDERDAAFAKKYHLPVRAVVDDKGVLIHSGAWSGLGTGAAKARIGEWLAKKGIGGGRVQYRLRDWLISRQRYWGPPIPMIFCAACAAAGMGEQKGMSGWYAVPEKDLPVKLPFVKDFRPHGKGQSPLASVKSFYEVKCPACKAKARRETDVSDTFLDSAWYYLRYPNVKDKKRPWDPAVIARWFPVDMYIGGAEHSVLHLLYVRFLALALHDLKLLSFRKKDGAPEGEPFPHFRAHGLIIKEGAKMSKSKGNVVNPDEYIAKFGADTLRTYLMFLAPFEQGGDFRDQAVLGAARFLERAERYVKEGRHGPETDRTRRIIHRTMKKVGEDIVSLHYNTAISALMICLNDLEKEPAAPKAAKEALAKMLAPFAPYLAEDLWRTALKHKKSVHREAWPRYDKRYLKEDTTTLVVQVDGKVRATLEAAPGLSEDAARALALGDHRVQAALGGKTPKRVIYVPGRLVNIVVS